MDAALLEKPIAIKVLYRLSMVCSQKAQRLYDVLIAPARQNLNFKVVYTTLQWHVVVGSNATGFVVSIKVTLDFHVLDPEPVSVEVEAAAHVALVPSRRQRGEAVPVLGQSTTLDNSMGEAAVGACRQKIGGEAVAGGHGAISLLLPS